MNMRFKVLMTATVVIYGTANAFAGPSYLDAGSKARGEFGNTSRMDSRSMYRAPSPMIMQRNDAIAQAPSARRSFSYEPSQGVVDSKNGDSKKSNPSAGTAQREIRTYRSFSYEPNNESSGTVRNRSGSRTPIYALPRTDGRKLGGG
jgi:hypothetical protein